MNTDDFSLDELDAQHTAELPARQLMAGLSLGLPFLGLGGFEIYVQAGPVELFTAVYV
jgi:hypothetical protein